MDNRFELFLDTIWGYQSLNQLSNVSPTYETRIRHLLLINLQKNKLRRTGNSTFKIGNRLSNLIGSNSLFIIRDDF